MTEKHDIEVIEAGVNPITGTKRGYWKCSCGEVQKGLRHYQRAIQGGRAHHRIQTKEKN